MPGLPGELKTLAGLINFALILNALAGRDLAEDIDLLARSLEREVKESDVANWDTCTRNPQTEQQSTAG